MSRGSGRLMRRIVEIVERAPERKMNRKDLDDVLVAEGYFPQNTLRAIKSLSRRHLLYLKEGASRKDSVVRLPQEVRVLSDDEIAAILKEISGRK
jgi:hypothetical protein